MFANLSGCEDAKIRVWRIPEGGLTETLEEPEIYLRGKGIFFFIHKYVQLNLVSVYLCVYDFLYLFSLDHISGLVQKISTVKPLI